MAAPMSSALAATTDRRDERRVGEGEASAVTGARPDVLLAPPSANARSRADWNRFSRCFSRQWSTTRSSDAGTVSRIDVTGGGSSRRIAVIVSAPVAPSKGRLPASISKSTTPKAKMSAR